MCQPTRDIDKSVPTKRSRQVLSLWSLTHHSWPALLLAFVDMLNSMRFGKLDPKSVEAFRKLSRPVKYTDGIGPTQLYPTRKEVDLANSQRLRELPDQIIRYPAADSPGRDSNGRPISHEQMGRLLER
ncbi:hypothetical protein SERLADRAFT_458857, partial [Serpula lacrymans var. lacrymans S7.9]